MLTKIRGLKGQSTLEYAVLVVIVIAALLSLQTYVKRGLQGRYRESTDQIGSQFSRSGNSNYYTQKNTSSATQTTFASGVSSTTLMADKVVNSNGNVSLDVEGNEYWGFKAAEK